MSKYCCCCKGEIDINYDELSLLTQILPKKQEGQEYDEKGNPVNPFIKSKLYPTSNFLYSYGNVPYGKILNLNNLLNKANSTINVKQICFGDVHSLMLFEIKKEDNKIETFLYGYGSNENGQLGLDYYPGKNNVYSSLQLINLDKVIKGKKFIFWKGLDYVIKDICIGDSFSLISIVYPSNQSLVLYRFELKKEDKFEINQGQNNNDKKTIFQEFFNTLINGSIVSVKAYGDRSLILTNKNNLYIKGTLYDMNMADDYVLYGHFKEDIKELHVGINNCLLLTNDNVILGVGHSEYGEFGLGDLSNNYAFYNGFYKVNDYFKSRQLEIIKLSTGARHSLILCSNGKVYCFGDNSDGQCCGLEKMVEQPMLVSFEDEKEFIIDIKAGFNHSMAKSKNGKVYVWGDSAWDKLGFKETRVDQFIPVEISDMKIRNVVGLFAGPMQSAIFVSGGVGT